MRIAMPPLASSIGQQMGRLKEKSQQQAGLLANRLNLTSTGGIRLSLLKTGFFRILRKPITISPVWQRTRDMFWFQHRARPKNERPPMMNASHDEHLSGEATEDALADQIAPMVPEAPPSATIVSEKTAEASPDYSYPDATEFMHFSSELAADELEPVKTGMFIPPLAVSTSRIPGTHQIQQYQRPGQREIRMELDQQPGHAYREQPSEPVWLPLTRIPFPREVSPAQPSYPTHLTGPSDTSRIAKPSFVSQTTHPGIPRVQATPEHRQPHPGLAAVKAEAGRQVIGSRAQQHITSQTGLTGPGRGSIQTESGYRPLAGADIRILYSPLRREGHNEPGASFRGLSQHRTLQDSYRPPAGADIRTVYPPLQREEYKETGAAFRGLGQDRIQPDIV